MTDSSLPAGLIEAVARAMFERCWSEWDSKDLEWNEAEHAGWLIDAAFVLDAVFSWRDDKPCPNCKGHKNKHPWACTWCVTPCGMCDGSGRVEGDRRAAIQNAGGANPRACSMKLTLRPHEG